MLWGGGLRQGTDTHRHEGSHTRVVTRAQTVGTRRAVVAASTSRARWRSSTSKPRLGLAGLTLGWPLQWRHSPSPIPNSPGVSTSHSMFSVHLRPRNANGIPRRIKRNRGVGGRGLEAAGQRPCCAAHACVLPVLSRRGLAAALCGTAGRRTAGSLRAKCGSAEFERK